MNSILQAYYYIQEAGIPEPWKERSQVIVRASGDDVVIQTTPKLSARISASIRTICSRTKNPEHPKGISQVVTEVNVSDINGVQFLSKRFHRSGGDLFCHPDYQKVLTSKEYYFGENRNIHDSPWMYAELFRRQYGQASPQLDTLFEISKAYHQAPSSGE